LGLTRPWPGSTRKPPRGQKTFPWRLDNVDTDLSIPVFLRKDIGDGFWEIRSPLNSKLVARLSTRILPDQPRR